MSYFSVLPLVYTPNKTNHWAFPWVPYTDSEQAHVCLKIYPWNIYSIKHLLSYCPGKANPIPSEIKRHRILSLAEHAASSLMCHTTFRFLFLFFCMYHISPILLLMQWGQGLCICHPSTPLTLQQNFCMTWRASTSKWIEIIFWESYNGPFPGNMLHITYQPQWSLVSFTSLHYEFQIWFTDKPEWGVTSPEGFLKVYSRWLIFAFKILFIYVRQDLTL